ncbi:protein FAM13A [Leptopilina heterotoma]|uniref:protein FAM13A n=1 Tax=Leptopilina heterotoma TaxID=63436 RepID=UPI001CA96FD1|nr:protein FAM13A [Leptopilina heterotoma]XP_043472214.1 protein FAM13A [Leptopilina heterotoma]XP_043472216.1 protein FAM13A [Leptopilina heterotoma]
MRRPQQEPEQHNHHGITTNQMHEKDESRLTRVKRALTGSLLGRGSSGSNRVFGVPLETSDTYLDSGVPFVVYRLCTYIENHGFNCSSVFRLSGGNPRLAERLRLRFEHRGDADLENAACPSTAATILRQYLKELPSPLVTTTLVDGLLQVYNQYYAVDRESWIKGTKELISTLPPCNYRLLGFLAHYFNKYERLHERNAGISLVFAPVILPHVPPATNLLNDIIQDAEVLFADCKRVSGLFDCKVCKDLKNEQEESFEDSSPDCAPKPAKRKDRRQSCCLERKLIRSNSEERIFENTKSQSDIRRVSSHEDFNSSKHLHTLSQVPSEMGHGMRCGGLPLYERTNVSPVSAKSSPTSTPCDVVLAAERFECDAERLRSSERFSRSVTPRGRRQIRRRRVHKSSDFNQEASKENEENPENYSGPKSPNLNSSGPSFLEMLSGGPSRSPSPARPPIVEHEDSNNPTLTNWGFQHHTGNEEDTNARVEAMLSPRNSLLIPRRFYSEDDDQHDAPNANDVSLKNLAKHISSLKKKIKRYEDEFEMNFGYRPSNSDKMSNRDVKKLCTELNKLRKEHKLLKNDIVGLLTRDNDNKLQINENPTNNNNTTTTSATSLDSKTRKTNMEEYVKDIERKLNDKRIKFNRDENMEDLSYEQLMDEKISVQKALLHIENVFGRAVSKEDRVIVRPLYDKYRTLKRHLIRAGANKNKDSMSELATILEHEAMDFTSSFLPGNPADGERRASEPDMSHRGILDCIETDQFPTDSDSQHSSSEGSRGAGESLHSLPQDELLAQQRATREEKKRLRRALKELEVQFEARAGRRMQREDRGPQVLMIYETYKRTKAKLRLIDALVAKKA